jgi:hypothetical protein
VVQEVAEVDVEETARGVFQHIVARVTIFNPEYVCGHALAG